MNAKKLTLTVATLALVATATSLGLFAGCGSTSNSEPTPTIHDSGPGSDGTTPFPEAGSKDGGPTESGPAETSIPDTGACESGSTSCNTCYTDAQAAKDPLNACSTYTKDCVPVALTVPSHPTITP
jgi:hypothetical protein